MFFGDVDDLIEQTPNTNYSSYFNLKVKSAFSWIDIYMYLLKSFNSEWYV